MELRHLQYFLKIADTSSFTQAAAALHVTQPTLSHQIKQLEQELGIPLFDRVGRSIRLTEPGRVLREHALRALRELEAGVAEVSELEGLLHGQVRVGAFRSFGISPIPATLGKFHNKHPGVHISVEEMSLADMEAGLNEGTLDMALTTYVPPASERIIADQIFTEPMVLAVGRANPLYGRKQVRLGELASVELVLRPLQKPSRKLIDRLFAARGISPKVVMEISSGDATLALLRCTSLATICAARAIDSLKDVNGIPIDEPALQRSGAILWHRDRHRSAAAKALAQMIHLAYAPVRRNVPQHRQIGRRNAG